jgi:hypothetical protein
MHFITAQPDNQYLLWQVELQAYNLYKLGRLYDYVAVVGYKDEPSEYVKQLKLKGINIELVPDTRKNVNYISTIRPHILKEFFRRYPGLGKAIFYYDSDVIFRELPNFDRMLKDDVWYTSDTISYIGYNYILSKGEEQLKGMCNIVGISPENLKENERNSGGAQYLMKDIDYAYWNNVEHHSNLLFNYMDRYEHSKNTATPPIQKWCADMWAVLWNGFNRSKVCVDSELTFSWAVDPPNRYYDTKLLHMAGATSDLNNTIFYKANYITRTPFDDDMINIIEANASCGRFYAELIQEYSKIRQDIKY